MFFRREIEREYERYYNKRTRIVYLTLRFLIIGVMILHAYQHDFESVFVCALSLVLMILPSILERRLWVRLPAALEIIILLFIFAAEILGEINNFYVRLPHWDTILHTLNGFLCAAVGFALVDLLNRSHKFTFELSPAFLALVAFCFSMTVGVTWEFFEYGCDNILMKDMQKDQIVHTIRSVTLDGFGGKVVTRRDIQDVILVYGDGSEEALNLGGYLDIGLNDTMQDLIVNAVGATVFSIIGYFYVQQRGKGTFAAHFIPKVLVSDEEKETELAFEEQEDEKLEEELARRMRKKE